MSESMIIVESGNLANSYIYHIGDGFHYQFHRSSDITLYFRCRKSSCQGRALITFGGQFQHTQPHNHGPDVLYSEVRAARAAILNEAQSMRYTSFMEILRAEKRRIPNVNVRSRLTMRNLRSAMHRARGNAFPGIPQTLLGLTYILEDPMWKSLTSTLDFQDNIYLGTAVGSDFSTNLVFLSSRCLQLLREAEILFADGTFFITPAIEGCYQVFTLVTIYDHTVVPLAWCLLQSKSQPAYESVLSLIKTHLQHQWNFIKVICDFEDAMIAAFRNVFGVEVQGCMFHAVDAMAKHAKSTIGVALLHFYAEVQLVIWMCCALPLLPAHLLQRGLNAVGEAAMGLGPFLYSILRPYLCYIQDSWLNHANRGRGMSVCGSEHCTNNASESNNRRMRRKFGVHHPNVYHFLGCIQIFESETIDDVESLRRGLIPTRHRSVRAVSNDISIIRLTNALLLEGDNVSDQSLVNFLLAASLSIQGLIQEGLN